jgi:hypothetical protein
MRTSMQIVSIAVLLFFAFGCNNRTDELQRQNEALLRTNTLLNQDLTERDTYVNAITDSINAVYTSIEGLKATEADVVKEKATLESSKQLTNEQVRARLSERINVIRAIVIDDHKRIADLKSRLASTRKEYAGMKKLVDNLTKSLAERDQSITELTKRVQGLEADVNDKLATISRKNTEISQKDSVIGMQHSQITTAYYITGTKDELEKKGIIRKEGGFPWGLFGSTTVLASGFDTKDFNPIDNTTRNTIQIDGKIDEIIPQRNADFYTQTKLESNKSVLTISQPELFWKEKYLVIITDRPATGTVLTGMIPILP